MATHPRLVNKQFNSPIGLYSPQNVQEVLERESQILANGAVGINFHNPDVGKPANLKNSAVLRMLQEEENRQRNGIGPGNDQIARPLRENITWPPPEYEHKNSLRSTFKDVVIPGSKRVAWPPPNESGVDSPYIEQNAVSAQGGPQYPPQTPGLQQNNYQAPKPQQSVSSNQQSHRPLKPLDISTGSSSPLSSPLINQSPQSFRSPSSGKGWAPVHSPVATPSQPSWQQPSAQYQQPSASSPAQPSWRQTAAQYQQPSAAAPSQPSWQQPGAQSQQSSTYYQAAHHSVSQQTYLGQQYQPTSPSYQPSQQQYQPPQQQYQPLQQQYQPPQQQYQAPQQQQYQTPQQYQPPQQQYQPPQQQYQAPQQQYQPPQHQNQTAPQPSQFAPKPEAAPSQVAPRVQSAPATKPVEPPPTTITLRPQAPVNQAAPPVFSSQPATATLKGGKHLRGDLKWPPETVRLAVAEENRLRVELENGPAFKPKRPNKDYTEFFEQHALNSTYPGYKIPPGTQFYRPL